jgi:hypothetical protein
VTRWLALVLSSLVLLGGGTAACASDPTKGGQARVSSKVSTELAQLYEGRAGGRAPTPGGPLQPGSPPLRVVDDRVLIDAVAAGDVHALKADLEALGMREAVAFGRIVSGQLPIGAIGALDGLASLQFARPASATTHPGTVAPGSRQGR